MVNAELTEKGPPLLITLGSIKEQVNDAQMHGQHNARFLSHDT